MLKPRFRKTGGGRQRRWNGKGARFREEPGPFAMWCRRRPTLPRSLDRSTIGAVGLNDRVRNGNGCGPYALVASDVAASGCCVTRSRIRQRTGWCRTAHAVDEVSDQVVCESDAKVLLACSAAIGCEPDCVGIVKNYGEVKPHGRLGPLRSERLAALPRAAYPRHGL